MTTKNLLVELFVEELPPKALKKLGDSFAVSIASSLATQNLIDPNSSGQLGVFASPRRLAVLVKHVLSKAEDEIETKKLMPVSVGLDSEGRATPALVKKLQALGADESAVPHLIPMPDGKADSLFYKMNVPGATLAEGLQKALLEAIAKLPIPKVMTYQLADGWSDVKFVRPAHGLVALYGSDVVDVSALGLTSRRTTRGHRFLSHGDIYIDSADSYETQLLTEGKVVASFAARRQRIEEKLEAQTRSKESDGVIRPDALLDEVTALVEWPVVYECHFDQEFLSVPEECLILTMQTNQKYFPCTLSGALVNRFLVVSNIETADPSAIIEGNERVVRPRLADAKFFFDQDCKKSLESRFASLAKVVYHNKLGTQSDRAERVRAIARAICTKMNLEALSGAADIAARLAKTDLLTEMVGEFPELQGTMGWYYARNDKLPDDVALAITDHYRPRFAGDDLPRNFVGVIVALADKLETLVGMFGIGNLPTGDKDPFALRRHALGVIRMLIEKDMPLSLSELIKIGFNSFFMLGNDASGALNSPQQFGPFENKVDERKAALENFIYDRLAGSLREQGYSAQEVDAVLALRPEYLGDVAKRLAAVRTFAALPEAPALAAANKRISNILKKTDGVDAHVSEVLLQEPAEKALHAAMQQVAPQAAAQFEAGDYAGSLQTLAALRAPVDAFFEGVMVNAEQADLRLNRLGLLATLHQAMNRVADLSRLAS